MYSLSIVKFMETSMAHIRENWMKSLKKEGYLFFEI